MLQQNDRRSVVTGLRVNNETCEIFKPRDRVYWCSDRCCNECGIVETRVGTSNGDPSTDSYQIKRISDGVKIEVPGYILRRSAKYHPYHTRTRSSASTCSVHGPCHSKKVPQERKRRRHASGHPNPPDATIAKSLGNDGGFAKNHFSQKLLSPPENQEFGPLGIEIKPPNACAAPNCIMRRSNSGLPPVIQGWLSGPAAAGAVPPVGFADADNEADAAPLSTSPSADEGVDLSDAMFSFDDDMILSPPLGGHLSSRHNPCPASSPAGAPSSFPLPPALPIATSSYCVKTAAQQSTVNNSAAGAPNSDEDTPRTPVAVPPAPSMTYQQAHSSNGCCSASCASSRQQGHPASARGATDGGYFTRSQCSQHKLQTSSCSCVAFHFSPSSHGEGKSTGGGLLRVGSINNDHPFPAPSPLNNGTSDSPSSKVNKDCILEHWTAVSDEGIVDGCGSTTGAMPRTPSSYGAAGRDMHGFLSPDSTSGGGGCAGDLSGELSDDDFEPADVRGRYPEQCGLEEQTNSPSSNAPLMPSRVLRSRTAASCSFHHGVQTKSTGNSSSGYEGETFSEDELSTGGASKLAQKGVKPVRKVSAAGVLPEALSCPVSRRHSGRTGRTSRASEPSLSYNSLVCSSNHTQQWVGALLSNNTSSRRGKSSNSSSVDQVTTGLARMKTATPGPGMSPPPCNTIGNGAMYSNNDVSTADDDADFSDSQSMVGSDNQSTNSSEGETPSAKKTRLQQRLLIQEQMMQRKATRSSNAACAATSY